MIFRSHGIFTGWSHLEIAPGLVPAAISLLCTASWSSIHQLSCRNKTSGMWAVWVVGLQGTTWARWQMWRDLPMSSIIPRCSEDGRELPGFVEGDVLFSQWEIHLGIFALFESLEEIQDEVPENGMTIHNYLSWACWIPKAWRSRRTQRSDVLWVAAPGNLPFSQHPVKPSWRTSARWVEAPGPHHQFVKGQFFEMQGPYSEKRP